MIARPDGEPGKAITTPETAPETPPATTPATKCGFIAILGAPNAGKSTLLNRLAGTKLSIVTRKVQTTRMSVRAIVIEGASQMVFIDTPGIFAPRRRLDRAMVDNAWASAGDADMSLVLIDARRGLDEETGLVIAGLGDIGARAVLVLNKIDLVERQALLQLAEAANATAQFDHTFMISAETGDGVGDLAAHLAQAMPDGPWMYPEDQAGDLPVRLLAAEITREKLMEMVHDEVPYGVTVEPETWQDRKDGSARIEQVILIRREAHKPIVLGKGGRKIKEIGKRARAELEQLLDQKIHLFLRVKVAEGWEDDPERYRQLGLTLPKS